MDEPRTKRNLLARLNIAVIRPRMFWAFQAIFWFSVFAWRTAYTYAYGYGLGKFDLRLISVAGAIAATCVLALFIGWVMPRGLKASRVALIVCVTVVIGLGHTAADRLLYTAERNGWQWMPFEWKEFLQILSVNAWVFLSWAAFFIVILLFSRLRERDHAIQKLTQVATDARLQTLMHQLNPHFLFNTLNSLSALVAEGRSKDADDMLLQLSRFLRHVIDADHEAKTDLQSEIDILRDYLAIQKVRFGDQLLFEIDLPENCRTALIPNLILQPIVENAVKHGGDAISALTSVSISARRRQDRLTVVISDCGPGFSAVGRVDQGAGLELIRERLAAHYGTSAQLVLSNTKDGGASVVISMDFESAYQPVLEQTS